MEKTETTKALLKTTEDRLNIMEVMVVIKVVPNPLAEQHSFMVAMVATRV